MDRRTNPFSPIVDLRLLQSHLHLLITTIHHVLGPIRCEPHLASPMTLGSKIRAEGRTFLGALCIQMNFSSAATLAPVPKVLVSSFVQTAEQPKVNSTSSYTFLGLFWCCSLPDPLYSSRLPLYDIHQHNTLKSQKIMWKNLLASSNLPCPFHWNSPRTA